MYFFLIIIILLVIEIKNYLINYFLVNFYLCVFDCFFLISIWDVMKENKGVNVSLDLWLIICDGFSSLVCCFLVLKLFCGIFWILFFVFNFWCFEIRGCWVFYLKFGGGFVNEEKFEMFLFFVNMYKWLELLMFCV